ATSAGIALDHHGNAFLTGVFESALCFDATSCLLSDPALDSAKDAFTAKYDGGGTMIWAHQIGGALDNTGNAVVVDPAGNVFLAGTFQQEALFGSLGFENE